jgi:hypothetical protein
MLVLGVLILDSSKLRNHSELFLDIRPYSRPHDFEHVTDIKTAFFRKQKIQKFLPNLEQLLTNHFFVLIFFKTIVILWTKQSTRQGLAMDPAKFSSELQVLV